MQANLQICIHVAQLTVSQFHRIGHIKYKLCLYYLHKTKKHYIQPYKVGQIPARNSVTTTNTSSIDEQYFYSHSIPIQYCNEDYPENALCFFRCSLDALQIDKVELFCEAELLFSEHAQHGFSNMGHFKGKIHHIYNISTYLPITFDDFEVFGLVATYNSVLENYSFEEPTFRNAYKFFQPLTQQFTFSATKKSYNYFNDKLHTSITYFAELHNKLLGELKNNNKKIGRMSIDIDSRGVSRVEYRINRVIEDLQLKGLDKEGRLSLIQLLMLQLKGKRVEIYDYWRQYLHLLEKEPSLARYFRKEYQESVKQRFNSHIFSHRVKGDDWMISQYEDSARQHLSQATEERRKSQDLMQFWNEDFPIENVQVFEEEHYNIKFFEEIYQVNNNPPTKHTFKSGVKEHIVFLVHGLKASKTDLLLFASALESKLRVKVHISTANEDRTEEEIEHQGKRLAVEIDKVIRTEIHTQDYLVSMIGHSMGGLTIRSALGFLSPKITDNLWSYISICTPHLGHLYTVSTLISLGLWIMNTWDKCHSLDQILMKDSSDLRECYLYQLCLEHQLKHFKKLMFVASSQDQYVPYSSAMLEINPSKLPKNNQLILKEMVRQTLGDLQAPQISRLDVVFSIKESNFDSMVGRTGHVKFLSDPHFINYFVTCFEKQLR